MILFREPQIAGNKAGLKNMYNHYGYYNWVLLNLKLYIFFVISMNLKTKTNVHHFRIDGSNKSHIMKGNSAESMQGSQFDPTIACDDDDSLDAFYMAQQSKATETGG